MSAGPETVLLTGARGFLGAHVLRRLRDRSDARCVILSRDPSLRIRSGERLVAESLERLTRDSWRQAGVGAIDVVIHLAAFTPKEQASRNELEGIYRSNLLGTQALLESLPTTPRRIVFASTLDVYARTSCGEAITERSPVGPDGLYAASKLFGEQLVRDHAARCGSGYANLRYGHLFGPGEERYRKLVPNVIRGLLAGQAPVVLGDGSTQRDLLYVEDAAEATLRAADADAPLDPINIVRGSSVTVGEVVEALVRLTGFEGRIVTAPGSSPGPSHRFDATGMAQALGTWELVSLEEGLRREIEHLKRLSCPATT